MKRLPAIAWRARKGCAGAARAVGRFLGTRQEGASLVEYALLVALLALVCIAGIALMGTFLNTVFTNMKSSMTGNGIQ